MLTVESLGEIMHSKALNLNVYMRCYVFLSDALICSGDVLMTIVRILLTI